MASVPVAVWTCLGSSAARISLVLQLWR